MASPQQELAMQWIVVACYKVVAVSTLVKSCLVSLVLSFGVTSFATHGEDYDAKLLNAQQAFESGRLLRAQFKMLSLASI